MIIHSVYSSLFLQKLFTGPWSQHYEVAGLLFIAASEFSLFRRGVLLVTAGCSKVNHICSTLLFKHIGVIFIFI